MIHDIRAVLWKEWRALMREPGGWTVSGWRSSLWAMAAIGIWFGIGYRPISFWSVGAGFVAMGGVVLVLMQMAPDSVAGERERHTLDTLLSTNVSGPALYLGKAGAATCYGYAMGVIVLLAALVTSTIRRGETAPLLLQPLELAAALAAGLPVILLAALVGVWISARSETVRQAQQTLVTLLIALGLGPALLGSLLLLLIPREGDPPEWLRSILVPVIELGAHTWSLIAVGLVLVLNVVVLWVGLRSFERERLTGA